MRLCRRWLAIAREPMIVISPRGHSRARPSHPRWAFRRSLCGRDSWQNHPNALVYGRGDVPSRSSAVSPGGAATYFHVPTQAYTEMQAQRLAEGQRGTPPTHDTLLVIIRGPSELRRQAGGSATNARMIEGLVPEVLREEQSRARPPEVPSVVTQAGLRARR